MFKWVVAVLLALGLLAGGGASAVTSSSSKPNGAVLQVRRVLGTERSCAGWKSEPPASKPVVVRGLAQPTTCYRLGVSDVSLQGLRAKVQRLAGTWQIDVDMNKVQSAAFDRMARRDLHKMVATVVEGVAPMEPIIQVPTFFGKFAIVGPFTKRSAEHIALELEPT